ncbi:MAG: hypothetical protein KGL39_27080 [Patescibacteria group bacterium]|nr:hypothetical protein [Patescibacteria group bacterium]
MNIKHPYPTPLRGIISITIALLLVGRCHAMDRWEALSQIETGDNDRIVGASDEVSRFQITPHEWFTHTRLPLYAAKNPFTALNVAGLIMAERIRAFEITFHRAPTDFEFYVLWNRPGDIRNPQPRTRERACRFANLCQKP